MWEVAEPTFLTQSVFHISMTSSLLHLHELVKFTIIFNFSSNTSHGQEF